MDIALITIIAQLIFLEGILSIDNAAVLGAIANTLPNNKPVPWPAWLHFMSHWSHRALGTQRTAALKVGLVLGYVLRGIMLILAAWIITVPWLRIAGSIYLVYLGIHYFGEKYDKSGEDGHAGNDDPKPVRGFWITVAILEFTDLIFSIDNVIAAVALSDKIWVVMLGVSIGIILMRFAAVLFSRLISWEPAFESSAFLLLFAIGGELLISDVFGVHLNEMQQFAISAGILVGTLVVSRTFLKQPVSLILKPFRWLCYIITISVNWLINLLLSPFRIIQKRRTQR
jgi:tellurite resistance protein TerC